MLRFYRDLVAVNGFAPSTHWLAPAALLLSYTAYRYRVLYYSHSIKPVPVAGREAHIHLCIVSVVRSSTSGPLVASDTDSSPAPSSQPSSLQFVAVGIRRPRRQSYVVFQSVNDLSLLPFSLYHSVILLFLLPLPAIP